MIRVKSGLRTAKKQRARQIALIDMRLEASPVPHHLTGLATPRVLSQTSIFCPGPLKLVVETVPPFLTKHDKHTRRRNSDRKRGCDLRLFVRPAVRPAVRPESSSGVSKRPLRDHQRGLKRPLADLSAGAVKAAEPTKESKLNETKARSEYGL